MKGFRCAINPGDVVVHKQSPRNTRDDRRGVVIEVGGWRRASGRLVYCDVRWIDPDGDASDGCTRHDPTELEVIR